MQKMVKMWARFATTQDQTQKEDDKKMEIYR